MLPIRKQIHIGRLQPSWTFMIRGVTPEKEIIHRQSQAQTRFRKNERISANRHGKDLGSLVRIAAFKPIVAVARRNSCPNEPGQRCMQRHKSERQTNYAGRYHFDDVASCHRCQSWKTRHQRGSFNVSEAGDRPSKSQAKQFQTAEADFGNHELAGRSAQFKWQVHVLQCPPRIPVRTP